MRKVPMYMKDWIKKLDNFLQVNERNILTHTGQIAHETAKELAEVEYSKFYTKRIKANDKNKSDFDKFTKQIRTHKKQIKKDPK